MKKYILLLMIALASLMLMTAQAELHLDQQAPEEWNDRADIMRVTMVDVGRSDSMLIEIYGKSMLIDGGYAGNVNHLQDVLDRKGIKNLTWMVNTHPHDDHVDGMASLLRRGYTADVFVSPAKQDLSDTHQQAVVRALKKAKVPYFRAPDGHVIRMEPDSADQTEENAEPTKADAQPAQDGQVTEAQAEEMPAVVLTLYHLNTRNLNDGSLLTRVEFGETSMLLMADLTRGPQDKYLKILKPEVLKADIVKAPHHGITPFSVPFLKVIDPQLVVIPNRPNQDTKLDNQCRKYHIPTRWSGGGDIIMHSDGTDWYVWQLPHERIIRR